MASVEKRKPRADAVRNRERLVDAAKAAFAETGAEASLEEIARRAAVGIGTLYRHFPTRDAIIGAVYRREIDQLADAAEMLLGEMPPAAALERWLRLAVDYLAAKRLILPVLGTMASGATELYAHSGDSLARALTRLVEAGVAAGDIRADVEAEDLYPVFSGLAGSMTTPGWEARAGRLIDVVMAGLRAPPAG